MKELWYFGWAELSVEEVQGQVRFYDIDSGGT